jgi:hypothetical protein
VFAPSALTVGYYHGRPLPIAPEETMRPPETTASACML